MNILKIFIPFEITDCIVCEDEFSKIWIRLNCVSTKKALLRFLKNRVYNYYPLAVTILFEERSISCILVQLYKNPSDIIMFSLFLMVTDLR